MLNRTRKKIGLTWLILSTTVRERPVRSCRYQAVLRVACARTLIWYAKSQVKTVLEVLGLRYDIFANDWPSYASRISEKMKKANEGCEGQTKARRWPKTKFQIFFTFLGSLGVFFFAWFPYFWMSRFLRQKRLPF